MAELDPLPRVLVSASGIDYYPDTADEMTEESGRGTAFLSDVVQAWEGAADPARAAGITVSHARSALVLARRGGVLGRLRPADQPRPGRPDRHRPPVVELDHPRRTTCEH